jgi:hypothetical protein
VDKMRFYLKTSEWTYGLEVGCTECSKERFFDQPSNSSYFLVIECLSGIMTNRRLFTNLGNLDHLEYSETLYNLREF